MARLNELLSKSSEVSPDTRLRAMYMERNALAPADESQAWQLMGVNMPRMSPAQLASVQNRVNQDRLVAELKKASLDPGVIGSVGTGTGILPFAELPPNLRSAVSKSPTALGIDWNRLPMWARAALGAPKQ